MSKASKLATASIASTGALLAGSAALFGGANRIIHLPKRLKKSMGRFLKEGKVRQVIKGGPLPTAAYDLRSRVIYTGRRVGETDLLHEAGHARSLQRKFSFNKLQARAAKNIMGDLRATGKIGRSRSLSRFKGKAKAVAFQITRPVWNLAVEAEANAEALKYIKKREGWKGVRKRLPRLSASYGTYVLGATTALAVGGALYHSTQALRKRKRER